MLIVLAGLPGTGKTTIARLLSQALGAAHIRVDTIEQALQASGPAGADVGPAGYVIAYGIAADNLRLGLHVVADSVNPVQATRQAWLGVAAKLAVPVLMVEISCSDPAEHRRRVETRQADIEGHVLPRWEAVQARAYEPVDSGALLIDTARLTAQEAVQVILDEAGLRAGG